MFQTSVYIVLSLWLIPQISDGYTKTFRCDNGEYIQDYLYPCEGAQQCSILANEQCNSWRRARGMFQCDNQELKNITVRCNTLKDCNDGTDELNCGDEVNVKNCTNEDKFLCHDGLRSLDLDLTCNGDCNCFDCSDENNNCTKQDVDLLKRCPKTYFNGANGPLCLCEENEHKPNNILCKEVKNCTSDENECDHYCYKYKSAMRCLCHEGYHIFDSHCRSKDWYEHLIIYATKFKIKSLNMTSNKTSIIQNSLHKFTALTAANNYIYYATLLPNNTGVIFKSPIASGKSDLLVESDSPITSIAVDYVTNNVYFTSNGSLSVCSSNGKICVMLKCCDIDYVAVAPKSGLMFYLQIHSKYDQKGNYLMKSNMDGLNEIIFVEDAYEYQNVNFSIVVDESISTVYLLESWNADGSSSRLIDKISFDEEHIKTVVMWNKMHNLAVLDGGICFTEMNQISNIFHSNKFQKLTTFAGGSNAYVYFRDNSTSSINLLFGYNGALQRGNENPCDEASCSGLCLVKPTMSLNSTLSYNCVYNNSTSTGDNHCCTNLEEASGYSIFWIVVGIIILMILACQFCCIYRNLESFWFYIFSVATQYNRSGQDSRRNSVISDRVE